MVSYVTTCDLNDAQILGVLILVVVEDGLVLCECKAKSAYYAVLILVVVEDGLVHDVCKSFAYYSRWVLILIVVDNGLVHLVDALKEFNPKES